MASKASGSPVLKKNNLPQFDAEVYTKIPSGELMVYSIHYLQERGGEFKMEDIVSACFMLFPKIFALKKYAKWPDSAFVSRRLSDCRSKRLVVGYLPVGFKLTAKGTRLAERVARAMGTAKPRSAKKSHSSSKKARKLKPVEIKKAIEPVIASKPKKIVKKITSPLAVKEIQLALPIEASQPRPKKKVQPAGIKKAPPPSPAPKIAEKKLAKSATRRSPKYLTSDAKSGDAAPQVKDLEAKARAGKFVRAMETSDAFRHFKKDGAKSKVSEFDFRSMLLCTMESSAETLARNAQTFKGYAGIHNRQDLIAFIEYCEERFASILKPQVKQHILKIRRFSKSRF